MVFFNKKMYIYPVIILIPKIILKFDYLKKKSYSRFLARKALEISSQRINLFKFNLLKNDKGVPIRIGNFCWSVTHRHDYVGGIISNNQIGIDIEKIFSINKKFFSKIACKYEWDLSLKKNSRMFFRYWTAKESVLKAECVGLINISNCLIIDIKDEKEMILSYRGHIWQVEHFYFDNYIVAIATNNFNIVKWTLMK